LPKFELSNAPITRTVFLVPWTLGIRVIGSILYLNLLNLLEIKKIRTKENGYRTVTCLEL